MASNTFGRLFQLTSYGESHGHSIGGIIDGCPSGLKIDLEAVQLALDRRKPGTSEITSPRKESDEVEFMSGIFENTSTGTPIAFLVKNRDARSQDYDELKKLYRPSHADFSYDAKYGFRDHRGGGRSSARETVSRIVAGEIGRQMLEPHGVSIAAYVSAVGDIEMRKIDIDLNERWQNEIRCPDAESATKMRELIESLKAEGDSVGGVISCVVSGLPPGLGEPVFDKFNARLAAAMMSINAVKAVEIGSGVNASKMKGSEHNDEFEERDGLIRTRTNNSGGIQGGLTNGENVLIKVHFKPVATIGKNQQTVGQDSKAVELKAKGRHDPCVVPRAVPIVEAMAALVSTDFMLLNRSAKL